MAGLLDSLYANDGNNPLNMGLLGMGAGLLAGANGNYGAFGPAMASGMMGAAQSMQNARDFELQNAYRQAQIGKLEQDAAKQKGIQSLRGARVGGAPGSPAGGSPGAGAPGAVPRSRQDVTMLKAMGGPDLLDQLKYANEGAKREAGATYRNPMTGAMEFVPKVSEGMQVIYGPDGSPSVLPIPGYSAANAGAEGARAGAIAAAQMPYNIAQNRDQQLTGAQLDIVQVPDGRGGTISMPRAALAQALAGPAPAAAGGGQPGRAGGLGYNPGPVAQDAAKSINNDWLTNSYRPALDDGKAASDLSSSLAAFRSIPLETGWGTETKAAAANMLTSLGIAPEAVQQYATDAQRFQSVAMDRLQNALMLQKGPQTEGDAQRAGQTFARLSNTPAANQFIVDFAQAQANQRMRKAQYYEAALPLAQRSGDLARVDREWRKIQGSIWNDPILAPYRPQERR
ncbi:hypothetical protein [Achromobacter aegrifaciens]|uniref:hypothetical protein n=1 Tax=Achromobacter aegrifaciens TaxID=1287736 RepID=UPI000F73B732|nr:hypothetical protein [Achromobacter aegrifaciens]RSE91223.1 hypothetical protein EGU54_31020 [Achromobacter aegrifaciens]